MPTKGNALLDASNNVISDGITSSTLKVAAHYVDGSNSLADGGFEVWTNANTLTNWSFTDFTTGSGAVVQTQNSTTPQAGTYSCRHVGTYVADQLSGITVQAKTGLTPAVTYGFKIYTRLVSGSGGGVLILLNDAVIASATQVLNWNTLTWEAWTGSPGANQSLTLSATGSWVQTVSPGVFPVPASGTILIGLLSSGDPGSSYTFDFDSAEFYTSTYVAANTITAFGYSNASNPAQLESTDAIETLNFTGGSSSVARKLNGLGAYLTDFNTFNFSNKGIQTKKSTSAVAGATPTEAEIVSAFGTAATVGAGFVGLLSPGDTKTFICTTDGTSWYFSAALTKAT